MNSVRIIGGKWRRRVLRFQQVHRTTQAQQHLRPTPDRVRETLFNWLGQDLSGQCCLDLFAGTGALGFEAASRGAKRVVLVERSPSIAHCLKDNKTQLSKSALADPAAQQDMMLLLTGQMNEQRRRNGAINDEQDEQQIDIVTMDALTYLHGFAPTHEKFDGIFIDPPYNEQWLDKVEPLLSRVLKPEGWIYAEAEYPLKTLAGWDCCRQGRAGQVYYHLLKPRG